MIQERLALPHGLVAIVDVADEDRDPSRVPVEPAHDVARCSCVTCQRIRLRPHGMHCRCARCLVS
jgi:hypothetical protein